MAINSSNSPSNYTVPKYNSFEWFKENYPLLKQYQGLGDYVNDIREHNLTSEKFKNLYPFLNTDNENLHLPADIPAYYFDEKNKDNFSENISNWITQFNDTISPDSKYGWYNANLRGDTNTYKNLYNASKDGSLLNSLGKEFKKWFENNINDSKVKLYDKYDKYLNLTSPTSQAIYIGAGNISTLNTQDRFKLSKAYNDAVKRVIENDQDPSFANRLSLYMTDEGIKHYGYGNHFDLDHQLKRWNRQLSNGKTVGDLLDFTYDYYDKNSNSENKNKTIYKIVRNATKRNFDITPDFWNKLGEEGNALRQAYEKWINPQQRKNGGKIFNMLFV